MPLHRRLPKRGFRNTSFAVKLNEIQSRQGAESDRCRPARRQGAGRCHCHDQGRPDAAREGRRELLGHGEFKAKADFSVYRASKSAVEAVEKAGGTIKILAPKAEANDSEPRGKNKRMALEAAKGGDKPKGGKPKADAGEEKPAD